MISTQNDERIKEAPLQEKREEQKKKRRHSKPRDSKAVAKVAKRFSSCARCSFFLAAYRVTNENALFVTAVDKMKENHLTLQSDYKVRKLMMKSYGINLFSDTIRLTSCCPECHRSVTYSEKEGKHLFQIQL